MCLYDYAGSRYGMYGCNVDRGKLSLCVNRKNMRIENCLFCYGVVQAYHAVLPSRRLQEDKVRQTIEIWTSSTLTFRSQTCAPVVLVAEPAAGINSEHEETNACHGDGPLPLCQFRSRSLNAAN